MNSGAEQVLDELSGVLYVGDAQITVSRLCDVPLSTMHLQLGCQNELQRAI